MPYLDTTQLRKTQSGQTSDTTALQLLRANFDSLDPFEFKSRCGLAWTRSKGQNELSWQKNTPPGPWIM